MGPLPLSQQPRCIGCGERKQPNQLVDGFCVSARYAQRIPKLTCIRSAWKREPIRFQMALDAVLAARESVSLKWKREEEERKARGKRATEAA